MSTVNINDTTWAEVKDGAGTVDLVATGLVFYLQCPTPISDTVPIPAKPLKSSAEWTVKAGRSRRLTVFAGMKGYCRCVQGSGTVEVTEVV